MQSPPFFCCGDSLGEGILTNSFILLAHLYREGPAVTLLINCKFMNNEVGGDDRT